MADRRTARRDAERAALEFLSGTLVAAAADLGEAHAAVVDAATAVDAARVRGEELVRDAQQQAAALVAAATDALASATEAEATRWDAARQAGWTPAQLRRMGHSEPQAPGRRRVRRPAARPAFRTGAHTPPPPAAATQPEPMSPARR